MVPVMCIAAFVIVAVTAPKTPAEVPAPMSEDVARVRLSKLGYSNVQSLKRNGDVWDATVTKNGEAQTIHLNALTGAQVKEQVIRPMTHPMIRPSP